MLNGYRALDLTDERGFYCGKVLGELGVDVIKIEKPRGDASRNIGPFYHDIPDPRKSLYWFAYNESKRGITLDIEKPEGQDIFKRLIQSADFVIESFLMGYMDKLDLGYQKLSQINPRVVVTSITPFGQTGPYKDYKASDIVVMAMGGIMSITGLADGVPIRLEPEHSYCLAGSNAAIGTLVAHYYRENSGEGQHVDVAMSECVMLEDFLEIPWAWEFSHHTRKRNDGFMERGNFICRAVWPCKDGYVTWVMFGGSAGEVENLALAKWLDDEKIPGEMPDIDLGAVNFDTFTQEEYGLIENRLLELFSRHTKKEIEEEAIKRGIRLAKLNDMKDLYESMQLRFRNYWKEIQHPELSTTITYPGGIFSSSMGKVGIRYRAPLIGEHNRQIYEEELGFSKGEVARLKKLGII
jgi:benzylsuccinate CoA-transferase BbsE subunit